MYRCRLRVIVTDRACDSVGSIARVVHEQAREFRSTPSLHLRLATESIGSVLEFFHGEETDEERRSRVQRAHLFVVLSDTPVEIACAADGTRAVTLLGDVHVRHGTVVPCAGREGSGCRRERG